MKEKKNLHLVWLLIAVIYSIFIIIFLVFNVDYSKDKPKVYPVESVKCYRKIDKYCNIQFYDKYGDYHGSYVAKRKSIIGKFKNEIKLYDKRYFTKFHSEKSFLCLLGIILMLKYLTFIIAITGSIKKSYRMKVFYGSELILNVPYIIYTIYFEGLNLSVILYPLIVFVFGYIITKSFVKKFSC